MDEMKRILDQNAITEAKTKWEYYVPRIIKQAKMEKGVQVEKKIREFTLTEEDCKILQNLYTCSFYNACTYHIGNNPVIAISLLPYLIPDARSKPELEKILLLSHVSLSSQFKAG